MRLEELQSTYLRLVRRRGADVLRIQEGNTLHGSMVARGRTPIGKVAAYLLMMADRPYAVRPEKE